MPSTVQTVTDRKAARIALTASTKQVQANWQLLKVYITKAYNKSLWQTKLDAAGASFYGKASLDNWSSISSLIEAANAFYCGQSRRPYCKWKIPATFQTTFQNEGENCINLSNNFFGLNMQKQMATSAKIDANNAIYTSVMEMLKDGQQIFKDDAATKRLFTFNSLVAVYKGEGSASLTGPVLLNDLDAPRGRCCYHFFQGSKIYRHYQCKRSL